MSKDRSEKIEEYLHHIRGVLGIVGDQDTVNMAGELAELIDEQAERVQELEIERSEWKVKHSILKRKYKGLQQKMDKRWRYNRAVQNESRANKVVLERFRERNKRYREYFQYILDTDKRLVDKQYFKDIAYQALDGESE